MTETITRLGTGKHLVSAEYFIALQEFAWERGMEPQVFMQNTGLPLSILIQPHSHISATAMEQAVRNVLAEFDSPALAIEYGRRLSIADHGALGVASQSSKDLYTIAELLGQFIKTRSSRSESIDFEIKGDRACIIFSSEEGGDPETMRFYITSLLMTCETGIRTVTGTMQEDIGSEISIEYESPGEILKSDLPPGLSLQFGQEINQISIPIELMQRPLAKFNPELFNMATSACEEELAKLGITENIVTIVRSLLRKSEGKLPNVDSIADHLNMSARTLKRKLSQAGVSYQQIKDSERFRKAMHLLEFTDETMEQIAEQLGYSDASSFNKAFKAWSEVTPSEYRHTHQAG